MEAKGIIELGVDDPDSPIGDGRVPHFGVAARFPFLPSFRVGLTELEGTRQPNRSLNDPDLERTPRFLAYSSRKSKSSSGRPARIFTPQCCHR